MKDNKVTMVGMAVDSKGRPVKVDDPNAIPEGVLYVKSFIKESDTKEFYIEVLNGNEMTTFYDKVRKSKGYVLDNDFAVAFGFGDLETFLSSDGLLDVISSVGCAPFFDEEEKCWMILFDIARDDRGIK